MWLRGVWREERRDKRQRSIWCGGGCVPRRWWAAYRYITFVKRIGSHPTTNQKWVKSYGASENNSSGPIDINQLLQFFLPFFDATQVARAKRDFSICLFISSFLFDPYVGSFLYYTFKIYLYNFTLLFLVIQHPSLTPHFSLSTPLSISAPFSILTSS